MELYPTGNTSLNAGPSAGRTGKTSVGQDIRDRFSGAVEAFSRRNASASGRHSDQSRHKTSEDILSSKDVQMDPERDRSLRNGSSSISSSRPSSSGEPNDGRSSRLVSSSGCVSTAQRAQSGLESKPLSFSRTVLTKGSRNDALRSFEFLSIKK